MSLYSQKKGKGSKGGKRVQFAAQEKKRKEILDQLTTNGAMNETIQKACHLLMDAQASASGEGEEEQKSSSFLSDSERESLISLLNKPLLDEVVEERVLRGLCCNLASCLTPHMTEHQLRQSKTRAAKNNKGNSVKDLSERLRARRNVESSENDEGESSSRSINVVVTIEPLFCSEICFQEFT